MKCKILNEITDSSDWICDDVNKEKILKEEVIKWIKEEKKCPSCGRRYDNYNIDRRTYHCSSCPCVWKMQLADAFCKEFFSLTEEELYGKEM